jgi:hypothetical protein
MIAEILNSHGILFHDLGKLLVDVSDELFFARPVSEMNPPAWIVGHLVYSCQMIGGEIGLTPWLDETWVQLFATGSEAPADSDAYPDRASLMSALDEAGQRLADRLAAMSDEYLAVPLPDERYRDTFPTLGHAVLHILTVHAAFHVGQLSAWRRAARLPRTVECR